MVASVGNQLPILLISFFANSDPECIRWESVTNPLDKLSRKASPPIYAVGNQLPILLISFSLQKPAAFLGWESVTNPLDKLWPTDDRAQLLLGISYQSS